MPWPINRHNALPCTVRTSQTKVGQSKGCLLDVRVLHPIPITDDSLDDHLKIEGKSRPYEVTVLVLEYKLGELPVPTWDSVRKSCVDFNNIWMVGDSNHSIHHNKLHFYSREEGGHWTVNYICTQSFITMTSC